jgi:hypothetical protein
MFLMLIMFVQIYDITISKLMNLPFSGELYSELSSVFDTIRIYPVIMESGDKGLYWDCMFILLAVTLIYSGLIFFQDYILTKSTFKIQWPSKLQKFLEICIFWLLTIPTTDFFISIFECKGAFLKGDSSMECWGGEHIFLCVLFSIGIVFFLFNVSLISLLGNESRPFHTDALSRLDINNEIYLTFYRIIITAVSHYTTQSRFHWLILALHAIISAHLTKIFLKFLPYYSQRISILYGAGCFGYLWVTANGLLIKALESIEYRGQIMVLTIGFIFIYPAVYFLRERIVNKLLL